MIFKSKKEKKEPKDITDAFFRDPITERLIDLASEFSDTELVTWFNEKVKPLFALAKSLALKSSFGMFSEDESLALFTTPKSQALRDRLLAAIDKAEDGKAGE
jgi:hypothetical protein